MGAASGWQVLTRSAAETEALAAAFGHRAGPGHVFALVGPLGAGKTVFVRGLGRGLGVGGDVASPTFTLVHRYEGRCPLVHVDAYRLDDLEEWRLLGLEDLLAEPVVAAVEWAERIRPLLPGDALWVELEPADPPEARRLTFRPAGPAHRELLEAVRREWSAR